MESNLKTSPFPKNAYGILACIEDHHWWFRARNQILIWILKTRVNGISNILEVGCGTGFALKGIAEAFPRLSLEASEYFEAGLEIAQRRVPRCRFRHLDAIAMTEADAYDCIGSFDVLEHIQADQTVLVNFYRALRTGGFLVLTVPQHSWLWSGADTYAHHVRRYSCAELRAKVSRAGFQLVYSTSFVSILLPLMALQRLKPGPKPYSLDDDMMIHPAINSLLYHVMQIEFLFLRIGLRFPAGGSLLLLARKP